MHACNFMTYSTSVMILWNNKVYLNLNLNFSPDTPSVSPCQHRSTKAPYSYFIHLPQILHNLIKLQSHKTKDICHSQNFKVMATKLQNKCTTKITHRPCTLNCIIDIIILNAVNGQRSRQANTRSSIPVRGHRVRIIHLILRFFAAAVLTCLKNITRGNFVETGFLRTEYFRYVVWS